jgi:hypothetical protein
MGRVALPVTDEIRLLGLMTLADLLEHCIINLRHPDAPLLIFRLAAGRLSG